MTEDETPPEAAPKLGWKAAMRSMFTRLKNDPFVQSISHKFNRMSRNGDFLMAAGLIDLTVGLRTNDRFLTYGGTYLAYKGFQQNRRYLTRMIHHMGSGDHFHLHVHPHPA